MTIAFHYRERRRQAELQLARVGDLITLSETVEYTLIFPHACPARVCRRLRDLGGDLVGEDSAILTFGNFVGRTELAGANIDVVSTKIGPDGVSRILQDVSDLASSLVFGWHAPIGFEAAGAEHSHAPVPYHQLQFLRKNMLETKSGDRLQDWLSAVERNPTRRFEPERPVVSPDRVRRIDHRAVQSIFSRLDRLIPIPEGAAIGNNPLAKALTFGTPPALHFPSRIAAPRGKLSFDTPENRFVKHVINDCLALVYRFADHPKLHSRLRDDCRQMLSILEHLAAAPYVSEAGGLSGFYSPSQALVKADGYREVFSFWNNLRRHVSLPRSDTETNRLLEGRDQGCSTLSTEAQMQQF